MSYRVLCIELASISFSLYNMVATILLLLLLLLLKKVSSAPQYQPVDRKKRKGKIVEDYSKDRAA